jgi:hypothetical protein
VFSALTATYASSDSDDGIILRFLPPNMTQWLQPLDLVLCGLIKMVQRKRGGMHLAEDLRKWRQVQIDLAGEVNLTLHHISTENMFHVTARYSCIFVYLCRKRSCMRCS